MNLIHDAWIPIKRRSGKTEKIAPWQITETEDPPVALAAPRPDFNGALIQFLIGLMQTAQPPDNEDQWSDLLDQPPTPEQLRESFEPFVPAFNLDGDGPLFMQEQGLEGDSQPIRRLFIEDAGDSGEKKCSDHFTKRGSIEQLCLSCAAQTLFTWQTVGVAAGTGYMTGLRGGGPVTTVVLDYVDQATSETSLWRTTWFNVMPPYQKPHSCSPGDSRALPWLACEKMISEKVGRKMTAIDVHPLHMYWAMPSRILLCSDNNKSCTCSICGAKSAVVIGFKRHNKGIGYVDHGWSHPLSPYTVVDKQTQETKCVRTKVGGFTYVHWSNYVQQNSDFHIIAKVLQLRLEEAAGNIGHRVWCFGYKMDDREIRKPSCWYETTYPLYHVTGEVLDTFDTRIKKLVELSNEISKKVEGSIKQAWFKRPKGARGDTSFLKQTFYSKTEKAFFETVEKMLELVKLDKNDDQLALLDRWCRTLRTTALDMFDYWANRADFATADPRRVVIARQDLLKFLNKKIKKNQEGDK